MNPDDLLTDADKARKKLVAAQQGLLRQKLHDIRTKIARLAAIADTISDEASIPWQDTDIEINRINGKVYGTCHEVRVMLASALADLQVLQENAKGVAK
jgi:hypothetical protein